MRIEECVLDGRGGQAERHLKSFVPLSAERTAYRLKEDQVRRWLRATSMEMDPWADDSRWPSGGVAEEQCFIWEKMTNRSTTLDDVCAQSSPSHTMSQTHSNTFTHKQLDIQRSEQTARHMVERNRYFVPSEPRRPVSGVTAGGTRE